MSRRSLRQLHAFYDSNIFTILLKEIMDCTVIPLMLYFSITINKITGTPVRSKHLNQCFLTWDRLATFWGSWKRLINRNFDLT